MKIVFTILIFLTANISPQTGGSFTITESVIAGGGGQDINGGTFSVDGTTGQPVAGRAIRGSTFAVTSGFWNYAVVPTAAQVSVGGQARTAGGLGIPNAVLTIMSQDGWTRSVRSSSFGYYSFDGITAGSTYIISISTKRYTFNQPTIAITAFDEITDLDFVADPL